FSVFSVFSVVQSLALARSGGGLHDPKVQLRRTLAVAMLGSAENHMYRTVVPFLQIDDILLTVRTHTVRRIAGADPCA
ncbi:MAG TPA: hypothetical protein VFE67_06395, partial [Rudaea sp.]|nr:hypothetical protein [Rudaea sp.]